MDRKQQLNLIWRHTHRDYKGTRADGVKTILVNENGATCLVELDALTDAQIAEKLPYCLKKEQERKQKKSAAVLLVKEFDRDGQVIDSWQTREFPADRHHEVLAELINVLDARQAIYEISQGEVIATNKAG